VNWWASYVVGLAIFLALGFQSNRGASPEDRTPWAGVIVMAIVWPVLATVALGIQAHEFWLFKIKPVWRALSEGDDR
jgi:hypothetical protein